MQLTYPNLTQEALDRLAATLAIWARPGFAILLDGDLGAGKSTFARAYLRALANDPGLDVPSPTFSLLQAYDTLRVPAAHLDLYRLATLEDARELGIEELAESRLLLVEWPDRLSGLRLGETLTIRFSGSGSERTLAFEPQGQWTALLQRDSEVSAFLATTRYAERTRRHFEGDASARRYEIIQDGSTPIVLMDMPARPDGPIIKAGKPYSRIAHLAETISAVIAVNRTLEKLGYSAPETHAYDLEHGFALMEHLGSSVYGEMTRAGADMREPMRAATELLADMARHEWPENPEVEPGRSYHVPPYDSEALLIEVDLLPSWYWPYRHGSAIPAAALDEFTGLWSDVVRDLDGQRRIWTMRDYHSPNLLWLPERKGLKAVGLIDTQDCVMGHPAYDLASLLQDARVDIAPEATEPMLEHYCKLRTAQGSFDEAGFRSAYAILGAQRSTKILGIFARLYMRDGKPGYLRHMPRVARHLARNLQHPRLSKVAGWFERHLPLGEVK